MSLLVTSTDYVAITEDNQSTFSWANFSATVAKAATAASTIINTMNPESLKKGIEDLGNKVYETGKEICEKLDDQKETNESFGIGLLPLYEPLLRDDYGVRSAAIYSRYSE